METDLIDWKAHWDSKLTYKENMGAMEVLAGALIPKSDVERANDIGGKKDAKELQEKLAREEFVRKQEEQEETLNHLFRNAGPRTGDADGILAELEAYNPHMLRVTLSTLLAINQEIPVINLSPPGVGKSRSSKDFLLDPMRHPFTDITGHLAPTDLFKVLRDAVGLSVVDESATLLKDYEVLNTLLQALWTKKIRWRDETANVRTTIVFNTNHLPKSEFTKALSDRCQFNAIVLSEEKIGRKIDSIFSYKVDEEVMRQVRSNVFVKSELDLEEIEFVHKLLLETSHKSVRDYNRVLAQAKFCKSMFGSVSYVENFVDKDQVSAIMRSDLSRKEKVAMLAKAIGKTERTAYNMLAEYDTATGAKS